MLTIGARAHDYGKNEPEALFSMIAADGFKCVMLAFQKALAGVKSYYDADEKLITRTKAALKENGLHINTLGVYMELGMANEEERQKAVHQFITGMNVAATMGIANVASETTPMHKQPDVEPKQALKALYRSVEEILPHAERLGIRVCLEPVYYHTLGSAALAKQLLRDMQSKSLGITFDPVNLFSPEYEKTQHLLWDEVFELLGEDIFVVHMKGIKFEDGKPVKSGLHDSIVDYPYIFQRLKALDRDLHVIREEADPRYGKTDYNFLASLC